MILEDIVAHKKNELAKQKIALPLSQLEKMIADRSACADFGAALKGDKVKLIAIRK